MHLLFKRQAANIGTVSLTTPTVIMANVTARAPRLNSTLFSVIQSPWRLVSSVLLA